MKAVVWHGVGDIRLDDVAEPRIEQQTDAIVKITASAICGTDLHMVRGTMSGMRPGTILGHEGVGTVEEVGTAVRNFKPGDRVLIPSTIACGYCSYCRDGYYAQCDNANPNGMQAGTSFFGGPEKSGPVNGLQAEKARIPFAGVGLVKIPDGVTDEQAILVSDIFPTGYMGAELAEIKPGNTVAIFGCGPVGQFAIASAKLFQAGRIFAVDCIPSRLEKAREQGAEVIDFSKEDPVQMIRDMTGGIGCDRAIDAVGVDAEAPHTGPAVREAKEHEEEFRQEVAHVAPQTNISGDNWHPGDAPSMTLIWGVECLAKAGTFSVIGVYPESVTLFPIGMAMNKNLTIKMGNCNHRKYIPFLLDMVRSGTVDPVRILTRREPLTSAVDAYRAFDMRQSGWLKVELQTREMTH
ncbi:formaldehyde dehydrogenase-related protein, glutathione-dependent [Geotalea daltonii FRC-32]|uniref:Formaldehyde dehydrogenase-related protein, glutathione-dependent n=1 Tax=Geotalea daltonii (strain DSM 22248 / JCM 15807 / FRC-32) TaxID=316067 RepID=B9M989_GEODF|nr:zinc-dependent alcohol dehydrogenase [Geotalea daltonii]ACM18647.1 formaldehyde dehydrogenase-related protein, glutathione-dependent [Geotalea daltonii FRC-32]